MSDQSIGYWSPDPMDGKYIRRPYQVLMVNRKSLDTCFWEDGFDTLAEAKEREHYLNCAEHWNGYIFYTLKLPETM